MRQGKVFYKDSLAGTITETLGGEYVFQYDPSYVKEHPNEFITFTMPVTDKPYTEKQIEGTFKRMVKNYPKALEWTKHSFLSNEMKTAYKEILKSRYLQLELL